MKKEILLAMVCVFFLLSCGVKNQPTGEISPTPASQHPELSEQEKLIACSSCHQEVTPEIYEQWYNSVHGLDNVKCFQCHGTYENFSVVPKMDKCATCHVEQLRKMPPGMTCWQCHPAHKFSVHK